MATLWQKIKNFLRHFFTLKDTPHNIAAGFALGVFLGIVPGGGPLTTLLVATFFNWNRASATIGVLASNLWTTLLILPMAATIGGFLFNTTPACLMREFNRTLDLGVQYFFSEIVFFDLALPLYVGFVIIGGIIALLSYLFFYLLLKYKKVAVRQNK
ncbi:MAG TPA: DUF2062 domain-containing protein [Candidatus Moranbacteria bacterium]|nr:DUF2062 domain-containing protein [Candidatus Moranbacteria bacterium]HRY27780.1 DUF2062 domain-containing protein [Candidatus Moranbacteria bacterium]HSA08141.1 DUF2062 domain-containing protein [Candidatus Moranbacteria bacterium]